MCGRFTTWRELVALQHRAVHDSKMLDKLSPAERRSIALFFAGTCLVLVAWALPDMSRLITIPGAIICFALAIWFLWPEIIAFVIAKLPARFRPKQKNPWKHTLEELFASEFRDLGNAGRTLNITFQQDKNSERVAFQLRFRLYQDFRSGTEFVSIFIPTTNSINIDKQIFGLIKSLPDQIRQTRDSMHNEIGIGMSFPGSSYQESKDLIFPGRVYIYTNHPFTAVQIGELIKSYQAAGLRLEIRGHEYWWAHKDR